MIRVEKQPEPKLPAFDFDKEVRQRGLSALAELTGQPPTMKGRGQRIKKVKERVEDLKPKHLRPYDYWTRALDALHQAYRGICAYASFRIEPLAGPTVDHFVAIASAKPADAYEWDNDRLACSLMNSRKNQFADVLDPCTLGNGWFELDLNTFKVHPGSSLDPAVHQSVENTVARLDLNSRECTDMRRRYFARYWEPPEGKRPVPFWCLEEDAPFLAHEMRRLGRIRDEDRASDLPSMP
ncbi:hypothetical protein [Chondromyces apiculatus]|uniref:Uncharacterized protein n=1 Tax=Chondromyces apiculatus DSM 436 TaxID=1192034 RepID=A0A017TFT9_9BACT|nr:hypothetical protein [Chondromyces apiculatus]EYF08074.1 Hypothetical protein CAP_5834 [Chondromyces apiculatus DSM 436]